MRVEVQQQQVAEGWTHVEGQDLHRGVEQFVSRMFNVSTAEEEPGDTEEHVEEHAEEHVEEAWRCSAGPPQSFHHLHCL